MSSSDEEDWSSEDYHDDGVDGGEDVAQKGSTKMRNRESKETERYREREAFGKYRKFRKFHHRYDRCRREKVDGEVFAIQWRAYHPLSRRVQTMDTRDDAISWEDAPELLDENVQGNASPDELW
jgi:hypothetical protein